MSVICIAASAGWTAIFIPTKNNGYRYTSNVNNPFFSFVRSNKRNIRDAAAAPEGKLIVNWKYLQPIPYVRRKEGEKQINK